MLNWWQLLSIGFLAGVVMSLLALALYGLASTVTDAVREWRGLNDDRD